MLGRTPSHHRLLMAFSLPTHRQLKMTSETVLVVNQPEKQKIAVKSTNFKTEEKKAFLRKFLLQMLSTFGHAAIPH